MSSGGQINGPLNHRVDQGNPSIFRPKPPKRTPMNGGRLFFRGKGLGTWGFGNESTYSPKLGTYVFAALTPSRSLVHEPVEEAAWLTIFSFSAPREGGGGRVPYVFRVGCLVATPTLQKVLITFWGFSGEPNLISTQKLNSGCHPVTRLVSPSIV